MCNTPAGATQPIQNKERTTMSDALALAIEEQTSERMFEADKRLYVVFYRGATYQGFESEVQGRPIFKDEDYIRIFVPGDKNTVIDRPVTEIDKRRFSERWGKYQLGQQDSYGTGTPLNKWTKMTPSLVAELNFFNVYTVEQVADMSDSLGSKLMGFNDLKRSAKAFLEAGTGNVELAIENGKLRDDMEQLKAQVAALLATQAGATPALPRVGGASTGTLAGVQPVAPQVAKPKA